MEDSLFISSFKVMKKFGIRLLVFVFVVFIGDRIVGAFLSYKYGNSEYASYTKLKHSLNAKEELLIFGSSRAQHHYDSRILAKGFGMSVYNYGFGGQGVEFSYLQLKETLKHNKPKHIILDLSVNILIDPEGNSKLRGTLTPYYHHSKDIKETLDGFDKFEKYKMISNIYPYNSTLYNIFRRKKNKIDVSLKGFQPLHSVFDTTGINAIVNNSFNKKYPINDKLEFVEKFIQLCETNDIPLTIVNSPIYLTNDILDSMNAEMKLLISSHTSCQYLDYTLAREFKGHPAYFKDNLHLNDMGAELLTKRIVEIFKRTK